MSAAFQHAPSLAFRQAWRAEAEADFRAGTARLGWRAGGFCVLASLDDGQIFTRATADHQRLWQLGDVLEVFLKDRTREDYWELHVAPTGHRLQLHFASAEQHDFDRSLVFEPVFFPRVRVRPGGWDVYAEAKTGPFTAGQELSVSVSRYDYRDAEAPPVLSSTSAHRKVNYHRLHEWAEIRLLA